MEAELTALKEELSTRSKPSTSTSPDHSLTNGGSESSSASEKTSSCPGSTAGAAGGVIRKTENIIKDESAEEKN